MAAGEADPRGSWVDRPKRQVTGMKPARRSAPDQAPGPRPRPPGSPQAARGAPRPRSVVERVRHGRVRYQLEQVRCGRADCRCAEGPAHGPYWYAYEPATSGRPGRHYLGKLLPAEVEAARALARSRRDRDFALRQEGAWEAATVLGDLAELLLAAEESGGRPFAEERPERLADLADELEEAGEELGQAVGELRRRVAREVRRLRERLAPAEEEEEEDDGPPVPAARVDHEDGPHHPGGS